MEDKAYQADILEIYQQSFRDNWSLPALTEYGSDEVLSYGEMARRIARLHLFYKQIGIKPGDKVAPGQLLLVYEAMKMENEVVAEKAETVKRIFVQPGQVVGLEANLIEFE